MNILCTSPILIYSYITPYTYEHTRADSYIYAKPLSVNNHIGIIIPPTNTYTPNNFYKGLIF